MGYPECTAREHIERYVRYGFHRPGEIVRIVCEGVLGGELPPKRVRELVSAEMTRRKPERKSWSAVTDCDRLDQAFAALRAEGIMALHNAGKTFFSAHGEMIIQYQRAGGSASGFVGYCFYHQQDIERALEEHKLGLAYGHHDGGESRGEQIGERVQRALEAAGLRVAWSGFAKDKIDITDFHWQRRSKAASSAGQSGASVAE
jgi:hypothetical protein